jgi:hypothetical protein
MLPFTPRVAGFVTGTKKKDTGKPDAKKDKKDMKDRRVCTYCEKEGHLEETCWAKHGKPAWKNDKSEEKEIKEDTDRKSSTATANLTSTSTVDSLWMAVEDSAVTMGNFYLDGACDAHACNRRDRFDSKTFVELKEGDRKVRGFDGSRQSAKGIGTIRLPMCLGKGRPVVWARIPDVLYLPGSANLISQGTLMDRGIRIEWINGYGAKLYDKAGRMIATARLRNKMLPLNIAWQYMPRESFDVNATGTRDTNGGDPLKSTPTGSHAGSPTTSRIGVHSFAFMATGHTMGGDSSISSSNGSPVGSPVGGCWAHVDPLSFRIALPAPGRYHRLFVWTLDLPLIRPLDRPLPGAGWMRIHFHSHSRQLAKKSGELETLSSECRQLLRA